MVKINAVILCGGEGTRLRTISKGIPKCVMPVNGKAPFLIELLKQLNGTGLIDKVVLAVGNKGELISKELNKRWKIDYRISKFLDMEVNWAIEDQPKGTLVGLHSALPYIESNPVLVMNGDTWCTIDFTDFYNHHVRFDNQLTVARFFHKDSGVWLINKSLIEQIIPLHAEGLSRESLLCVQGFKLGFYKLTQPFVDMGTIDGYKEMTKLFQN
jgi:NDP-sugar pyrophosphorylase family protein